MQLTDEQIDYISANLDFYGVVEPSLKEDLLDHICTYIENGDFGSFEAAYQEAIQKFGGQYAMSRIQQETFFMVHLKSSSKRKGMLYITGCIMAVLISTGGIFKLMHWPGANIMTVSGFIVLNFMFLPLFFYHWYKLSEAKSYSNH
jgi:hypothetical protein